MQRHPRFPSPPRHHRDGAPPPPHRPLPGRAGRDQRLNGNAPAWSPDSRALTPTHRRCADRPENHVIGATSATRYRGEAPDYAIILHPGTAPRRSVLEGFCAHHAARAVDIWCIDTWSNRPTGLMESARSTVTLATHAARFAGLPLFLVGFGTGAAVVFLALHMSTEFWGAVLADELPSETSPPRDEAPRYWIGDVLSVRPPVPPAVGPVAQDLPPMMCAITEHDPSLACRKAGVIVSATAARCEIYRHPADMADLMTSGAGSDIVHEWCLRQLNNHLNPRWNA